MKFYNVYLENYKKNIQKLILHQEIVWWQTMWNLCMVNQLQEIESWDPRSSAILCTFRNYHYTPRNNPDFIYFATKAWNLSYTESNLNSL
jgi:hypothetical protein